MLWKASLLATCHLVCTQSFSHVATRLPHAHPQANLTLGLHYTISISLKVVMFLYPKEQEMVISVCACVSVLGVGTCGSSSSP